MSDERVIYVVVVNVAGYMPETEPAVFDTWDEAKSYAIDDMVRSADAVPTGAEGTWGEEWAEDLRAAAEELNLASGPEWFRYVDTGGEHGIPQAWTIGWCAVTAEEYDELMADDGWFV